MAHALMKTPTKRKRIANVRPIPATLGELLVQLGDIPAERIRLDPPPGRATVKDLLRVLDRENIPCELVDGTLVEKAMGYHESRLATWLSHYLIQFLEEHDLGIVCGADAPHRLVSRLVRMPDVAYVAYASLPGGKAGKQAVAPWAPDLAVEVLSKGNSRREIDRKRQEYFDAGVRLLWVADPRKKTVKVYTSCDDCVTLGAADTLDGGAVLPGFKLSIGEWYAKVD